jgi:hypothetical protein
MSTDSVAATVYMYWQVSFYEMFFHRQISDTVSDESANLRQLISSNFGFNDFYMRLMHILVEDPAN